MIYKGFTEANVIITGACSGIGRELVKQVSESRANILAIDYRKEDLKDLANEFPQVTHTLEIDLSQKGTHATIITYVKNHWTHVDFCFANAGIAEFGPTERQNWEEMDRLFQLNVHSPIQLGLGLKEAFPPHPFRHVITASAMSYWTLPGYSLYAATKSALLQWAQTLWAEKTGKWLTLVFPIATKTDFFNHAGKNIPKAWPQQTAEWVASEMLRGAAKGKKKIYPSKLFLGVLILNRFFRFIRRIVLWVEYRKYKNWLKEQSNS
ncbi:SDR family NAD(P)-dependent oxidoreductase [Algoriphagus namhaensis]|uniref:SDR family NAD(P)-dependent oxidoreductase n=1 Tax=Algoriphagus namhaensis TaxID=915353 RepID=A0ABV8ANS3_9BACT